MYEYLLDIEQHIFNNSTYLKSEGKAVLGKKNSSEELPKKSNSK